MAKLADVLPLTQGTNRVIDDPASPGMLAGALSTLSDGLTSYVKLRTGQSEERRRKAAEEEKRRGKESSLEAILAYDRAISQVTPARDPTGPVRTTDLSREEVDAENPVFAQPTTELPPQVAADVTRRGEFIRNISTAVDQARMPAVSLTTALNKEFRSLLNRYPDQTEQVLDIWKKMGIDTTLFREGRDASDWAEFSREQEQSQLDDSRKFEQRGFELGVEALGETIATGGVNGGQMSREEVIAHGIATMKQKFDFEWQRQRAELQLKQAGESREQRAELRTETNERIAQMVEVGAYNDMNPLVNIINNAMVSIAKEPPSSHVRLWTEFSPRINALINNYVEQAVAGAVAQGYTGDSNVLRTRLNNQANRIRDLWTGEFSVAQSYIKALEVTRTTLKLNAAEAMPVYTALREIGINAEELQGFMEGIQGNTQLQDALRQEMRGFNTEFGRERASTHLMNLVKILRGDETLANLSPTQARQRLPDLYRTSKALTTRYVRGGDVNPELVLNGIGEVTIATRTLNPSSGINTYVLATGGFALPIHRQALVRALRTGDDSVKEQALATIFASRAASAQVLNSVQANIGRINQQSTMFKIFWSSSKGKYEIDTSRRLAASLRVSGQGPSLGDYDPATGTFRRESVEQIRATIEGAQPPKEMQQLVDIGNANLNNIVDLAEHDPNTPKATPLELRQYYGQNKLPKSMRTEGGRAVNIEREVDEQLDILERALDNPQRFNQDVEITDAIVGVEGTGDNPKSSATGTGQFIESTWLSMIRNHRPELAEGRSRKEILALRADPVLGREMTAAYSAENKAKLQAAGVPSGRAHIYLAHFLGPGGGADAGAIDVLRSDGSVKLEDILPVKAINSNSFLRGKTVQWLIDWAVRKVGRG